MSQRAMIRLFAAAAAAAVLVAGCGKKKDMTAEDTVAETGSEVTASGEAVAGEPADGSEAGAEAGAQDGAAGTVAAGDGSADGGAAASENAGGGYKNDYGITLAEILGTGEAEASGDAAGQTTSAAVATGDAAERAKAKGLPAPPEIDVNGWQYILASATHTLPEGYGPEDIEYVGDEECPIDYRIADNLREFTDDCEDAGYPCYLSSGYRSYETQEEIFEAKADELGYEEAAKIILPPGTSEHQTGLCCDITDVYRSLKNPEELSQTETFQWLNEHCEEYGFILRYPANKEEITDVIYEPWHFRYVGKEAAKYIKENDLCLEEFLALYGVE